MIQTKQQVKIIDETCISIGTIEKINKKDLGLYPKFKVTRTDGQSELGKKHHNCNYFVLDLDHDPLAIPAMIMYANEAQSAGYGILANNIFDAILANNKFKVTIGNF